MEISVWTVGVGLHKQLQPKLDFVGELGWAGVDVDTEGDTGLQLGFRAEFGGR